MSVANLAGMLRGAPLIRVALFHRTSEANQMEHSHVDRAHIRAAPVWRSAPQAERLERYRERL